MARDLFGEYKEMRQALEQQQRQQQQLQFAPSQEDAMAQWFHDYKQRMAQKQPTQPATPFIPPPRPSLSELLATATIVEDPHDAALRSVLPKLFRRLQQRMEQEGERKSLNQQYSQAQAQTLANVFGGVSK